MDSLLLSYFLTQTYFLQSWTASIGINNKSLIFPSVMAHILLITALSSEQRICCPPGRVPGSLSSTSLCLPNHMMDLLAYTVSRSLLRFLYAVIQQSLSWSHFTIWDLKWWNMQFSLMMNIVARSVLGCILCAWMKHLKVDDAIFSQP